MQHPNTKIVCTLGPSSTDQQTLIKMIHGGMNVARLNFSHGSHSSQLRIVRALRQAEKATGATVAIMQDLQGPKIRLGSLPESGIALKKNEVFILDCGNQTYDAKRSPKTIPVQYADLCRDVRGGDLILIEDGLIKTTVLAVKGRQITVKADSGGILRAHKGINVPTASISADPLTEKDIEDLLFGLEMGIDFVALSFVRRGADITRLRQILRKKHSYVKIVAKIERHEALTNLREILEATDAVMVARGDLGVETPAETVPLAQKMIVRMASELGKPVIIATEMLQSMVENPRATRAEISDAANAVFDHADALMLSNETATGQFPVQAVETLSHVAQKVEQFQKDNNWTKLRHFTSREQDPVEMCHTATLLADETNAKLIVALTDHGYTARHVSRQRTFQPIVVITPFQSTKRELQLCWGIHQVIVSQLTSPAALSKMLLGLKIVKKGDKIVFISNASTNNRQITLHQA
jgi:pyruvate kinase